MHPAYKTFHHLTGEQFQIIETCNAVKMRLKIDHVYGLGFTVCNSQSQFTVLRFLKIAHCYCKLLTIYGLKNSVNNSVGNRFFCAHPVVTVKIFHYFIKVLAAVIGKNFCTQLFGL